MPVIGGLGDPWGCDAIGTAWRHGVAILRGSVARAVGRWRWICWGAANRLASDSNMPEQSRTVVHVSPSTALPRETIAQKQAVNAPPSHLKRRTIAQKHKHGGATCAA